MNRKLRRAQSKQSRSLALPEDHPVPQGSSSSVQDLFAGGLKHHQAGSLAEAERAYRQVLAVEGSHADALHLLGVIAFQGGENDVAVALIGKAVGISGAIAVYRSNLGNALQALGRLDAAVAAFSTAICLEPNFAEAHYNLGTALKDLGRPDDAVVAWVKALRLKPGWAEAYSNKGSALTELGLLEAAESSYRIALCLKPVLVEAYANLGNGLRKRGHLGSAVAACVAALRIAPDYALAHLNLGIAMLLAGRYEEGWAEYEWRWREKSLCAANRNFAQPLWQGESLKDKTILLHAEQGMGDTIQFCRYAPLVAGRGGRVILEVPRSLIWFMSGLEGIDRIVAKGDPLPPFDLHCPLGSLPRAFGTRAETIPGPMPCHAPDPERVAHWQSLIGSSGFRIGIVWQGSPGYSEDLTRSVSLACFAPLARVPGVRLISLQKVNGLEQLDALPDGLTVENLGPDFDRGPDAFIDTAAVLMNLDLIVTVDSAIGHLAGTLGRPVWLALSTIPYWPWLLEREDTPWYPTTRLFRQKTPDDWGELFEMMASRLRSVVSRDIRSRFDDAFRHHQAGRVRAARQLYRDVVVLDPRHAGAYFNLGLAQNELGCFEDALLAYGAALRIKPGFVDARLNLGGVLQGLGRFDDAADTLRTALCLVPAFAAAHSNLAIALCDLGRHDKAIAACGAALHIQPDDTKAHTNLGLALQGQGRLTDAVAAGRVALCIEPASVEAHVNLGVVLYKLRRFAASAAVCRRAVRLRPDTAKAHCNLGNPLKDEGALDAAIVAYRTAICLEPGYFEAYSNFGNALQDAGRFDLAVAAYNITLSIKPDYTDCCSNLLMCLYYRSDIGAAEILAEAARFDGIVRSAPVIQGLNAPGPDRRLRVGYVSGDFRNHPVGYFLRGVLACHDPASVEVICYSNHPFADAMTRQLQEAAHRWRSLVGLSDQEAAKLVAADAIDILVDLSGHTAHNSLPMFARKPAPVQVTWLGFWGTTGLSAMDYILSDEVTIPLDEEHFYSEKVLRLPSGRLCYRPPDYAPPVSSPASKGVVFGSFNNLAKIGSEVVALWAKVLHAVPESKLLLKWKSLGDPGMLRQVTGRFAAQGIGSERLDLRPASPHAAMLAEYGDIDIALDPFPFSGGLTSCEALWMGVPVVTLPGAGAASRQTAGFLRTIGHEEWIAEDAEDYVRIAAALAGDAEARADVRRTLRPRMAESPLCDGPGFTRGLEEIYRQIWRKWCDGIDVPILPERDLGASG